MKSTWSGWINAKVKRFDVNLFEQKMPLPHMGWNVSTRSECKLFVDIKPEVLFLHSFFEPAIMCKQLG